MKNSLTPLPPKEILEKLKDNITDRTLRNDLQQLKKEGLVISTGQGKQTKWGLANPETRNNQRNNPKRGNNHGNNRKFLENLSFTVLSCYH